MTDKSYNHCPISVASAILEPRWTMQVLFELWSGKTRFNQFRRGLVNMSPSLLSKRLKEMEVNGLLIRKENNDTGEVNYSLTDLGLELEPIVEALGRWAHRNIDTAPSLEQPDVKLLTWDMMREVDRDHMPKSKRSTILFYFPKLPEFEARTWLVCPPNAAVELCGVDPGFDLDAIVTADLTSLTSVWLGCSSLETEIDSGQINMSGDPSVEVGIRKWLTRS